MTKEEALALIEKKRDEYMERVDVLLHPTLPESLQTAFREDRERMARGLDKEIDLLTWVSGLVKQIENPMPMHQPPQNVQNTIAAGWQTAITGELGKER